MAWMKAQGGRGIDGGLTAPLPCQSVSNHPVTIPTRHPCTASGSLQGHEGRSMCNILMTPLHLWHSSTGIPVRAVLHVEVDLPVVIAVVGVITALYALNEAPEGELLHVELLS